MRAIALCLIGSSLCLGCVTRSEHEKALAAAAERLRQTERSHRNTLDQATQKIGGLQAERSKLQEEIQRRDKKIAGALNGIKTLQGRLDAVTALSNQLKQELVRSGKNVDKLLAEKGKIATALKSSAKRLEELRRAQARAKKRAELFRQLALKFKKMTDAGDLKIVLREGRMVLQLRNDVLFDAGRTTIKAAGKKALEDVAGVLITLTDRKLQVAGHTDNDAISTSRYPSNWELSTARAVGVVKYLVDQGVNAKLLSAAGYSKFDPVAANDTVENKARNRRIEIVLQPNIGELVQVPSGS